MSRCGLSDYAFGVLGLHPWFCSPLWRRATLQLTHCALDSRRLQSHPGTWNEVQTAFSRKEVARALDSYRLNLIIVQARRRHHCQRP